MRRRLRFETVAGGGRRLLRIHRAMAIVTIETTVQN